MKKVNSISPRYILSIIAAIVYITFCLVIDVQKGVSFYQSTAKMHEHSNKDSSNLLQMQNSAKIDNEFNSIQNQLVVIDTLVYRIERTEYENYLVGVVICDNSNRILIKLKIDESEVNDYAQIVFKKVRLLANINRITSFPYEEQIYSIDNELIWHNLTQDYLLEGTVSEIISELPINS